MDPKLALVIMLFGTIIGLSQVGEGRWTRVKDQLTQRRWRKAMPAAGKI